MPDNPFFNRLTELLGQIGDYNQPPNIWLVLGIGVVLAAAVYPYRVWVVVRHGITILHEGGHAFVAFCVGRSLHGIHLHADTSGETWTAGPEGGIGRILTAFAGYPAACLLGFFMAWTISAGHAAAALWGLIGILLLILFHIRNLFGVLTVVISFLAVAVSTWFLPDTFQVVLATIIVAYLHAGGARTGIEIFRTWRRDGAPESDPWQLHKVALLPTVIWIFIFLLVDAAAIIGSLLLLANPVTHP